MDRWAAEFHRFFNDPLGSLTKACASDARGSRGQVKRSRRPDKGKDSSGTYSWTDVFQNRGGHWLAVASQTTKVTGK